MSRVFLCLVVPTLCATVMVSDCEAQIMQRIRERRAALLGPPADPAAADAEAASTAEPPVRTGFLARRLQMRRDLVAQQAEAEATPTPASPAPQPSVASQQAQRTTQRRPLDMLRQASAQFAPELRALTPGQVAALEVPALQAALADTSASLDNELNQLTTAASWREFLQLPPGIVDAGTVDLAALQTLFVRFENVAANPKYTQIASLPSFQQSRTLLAELVDRVDPPHEPSSMTGGPHLIDPTAGTGGAESLPAPAPQLPRNEGEHSILLRTPRS